MADIFKAASAKMRANKNLKKRDKTSKHVKPIDDVSIVKVDGHDHAGNGVCLSTQPITIVPSALKDEVCKIKVTKRSKRLNEATLLNTIEPSPLRTNPFCDVYHECGGCSMQHLGAQNGLDIKLTALKRYIQSQVNIPSDAIENENRAQTNKAIWEAPVLSAIEYEIGGKSTNTPQAKVAYRRRIRLAVDARNKQNPKIGFRQAKSNKVINISHCPIAVNAINQELPSINKVLRSLPSLSNIGHMVITQGSEDLLLAIHVLKPLCKKSKAALELLAKQNNLRISLIEKLNKEITTEPDDEQVIEDISGIKLLVGSHDFLQVNGGVNQQLLAKAIEWLSPSTNNTLYDFFCGTGNFALALAKQVKQVYGFEGLKSMVSKAAKNARNLGVNNCDFICEDLSKSENIQSIKFDKSAVVVLDPSREGAYALSQVLLNSGVHKILYVSCNPNSFVRDLKVLQGAYEVNKMCVLDMFPFTKHLEVMALFTRIKQCS